MEASLTCAVCLSVFENPTTLPVCSHNFCKKCILECVTKSFSYGLDYGGGGGSNIWKNSQLECPLCRKSNFIAEGAVNMPGNTTLAEVVKLFRSQQHQQLTVGGGREPEPLEPLAGGTRAPGGDAGERELCQRHPHRKLQLFCKVCKQLACGQCVSEDHRGVFHAVNLVDMIYQEEKLEYFNNLRELRQLNNRLKVEIADNPSDLEYVLDYDKEIIITKIDRILEKVELKKRQLIDEIEKKKEWKERERKAQLERKRTQKKTIEEYLKECEKLVNECNPVNFLKVACDLNERVKSNLAIVLPTLEKHNELTCLQPHQFLVKPVLDSISALQLTKDTEKPNSILDTGNTASELRTGGYQFKTTLKMWKQPKEFKEPKFVPETIFEYGCLDQIWCISAKEDHQNMSPEELRYKHYQSYRKDWNCFVTEGYADSENNLEPSLSSVPVELLKTPDGVQKPHDSSPVVNQQSSEKAPTDIGVETHKLKETLLAETLTSEPEIFHRIESANSGCVDFAAGFNKGLPSISTQQTQVPFVDDAIKTCKTKSVEVPKSTQQSVIGKIPFSQLGNATSIPENPLGRCSSDTDEEGKNPLIFGEQGCNTQVSHVTENQGYSDDRQSSVVTSEMEHPDSLTAKESPNLSRRRWTNIEPLNLSHTGDSACIPQSIASVASSFAEASNGNAQEDIKRIATDCSLFTATSPVFCPVFKFGAGNDFQFTLGTSNLTNSAESQEKNEEDCKVAQKTMLPSPPPVNDPATILDAENVLFSNRGKLYCFERMSLRWKERAFGEIRVLEDKITKLSRLVMWNATNKCCANHWITRDLELKHAKTSNCIWTWHALDYSENKQVLVEFAVHFKLKEMAQLFKQVIETVQSTTGIAELTKQKNDQNGNDDHTSLGASELKQGGKFLREMEEQEEDGDDVVMLSEVKPTPEQRALALELFLPPTFFCYKNRPGYQSSDDEEDSFETAVKKLYPNYNKFI
ncbi:hypothetical protein chiPu_0003154 [Chiloscyllium punctatum]|uniref:RING-type domain-containing protein n=1 Tax=Chiloscyllium punctatum TaxID=137246 RepID=A0A401S2Z9_CHIPU|nr:hypothetical protein [Chiloscyllium punctatum]